MKSLSVALIVSAAALIATGAAAADLGRGSSASIPTPSVIDKSYQGFYVELGGGYQVQSGSHTDSACVVDGPGDGAGPCPGTLSHTETFTFDDFIDSGFLYGRVGYDFQQGRIVGGPLAEIRWTNLNAKDVGSADFVIAPGARIGFLAGPTLIYGIAQWNFNVSGDGLLGHDYASVGAGLEIPLGDRWTLKPEVDYGFANRDEKDATIDNGWMFRVGAKKSF